MKMQVPERLAALVSIVNAGEVSDPVAWLHPSELEIGEQIELERRRSEWMMARIAVKQLAIRLGLCDDPSECVIPSRGIAPALHIHGRSSELHLSISHSAHLAAAAISPAPIGIDIQVRRPVDLRSRRFFLRDDEEDLLLTNDDDQLLELWSAKEAALKAAGVTRYREVSLHAPSVASDGRSFEFQAGSMDGHVETAWLDERRVVLALARGRS